MYAWMALLYLRHKTSLPTIWYWGYILLERRMYLLEHIRNKKWMQIVFLRYILIMYLIFWLFNLWVKKQVQSRKHREKKNKAKQNKNKTKNKTKQTDKQKNKSNNNNNNNKTWETHTNDNIIICITFVSVIHQEGLTLSYEWHTWGQLKLFAGYLTYQASYSFSSGAFEQNRTFVITA